MKKTNRILCIMLALAVVISSVPVFAYTEAPARDIIDDIFRFDVGEFLGDTEIEEVDPDIKRIEFLDSIGIWDDVSKSKDSLLTMTEFSVIMSKVKLGSENALLNVYGQDPNDNKVTYKNVLECILLATGYYYRCAEFGNTDEAILIIAADIGLISDNPQNINAYVTRGELARLLAKAITLDICIMEYTSTGGYKYTIADGENLLSTVHGIYDVGGFVNAVPGFAVYGGASLKKGYVQIERTDVNASGMDVADYFGTRVDAYAFFDDVTNEFSLVYIAPSQDNIALEIDFRDIVDIRGNEIIYIDENETELEITVSNFVNIIENGKKLDSLSQMSDYNENDGKLVLTASAKKGDFDTAIIYKYDYYVAEYIDSLQSRIGLRYGMKYDGKPYIEIDDKAINNIFVDGVLTEYTGIPVGRAIRVMRCKDTGYTEIKTANDRPSGEITMLYEDVLELGGKSYRISRNMLKRIDECAKDGTLLYNDKLRMPELGTKVTLIVYQGIIAGYTTGQDYTVAYFKSASFTRTSIDPKMTIRVFTQEGEWLDLSFAEKVTVDSVSGKTKAAAAEYVINNADTVLNELVRIKLNQQGECIALDTVIESDHELETTDDIAHVPEFEGGVIDTRTDWTKWNLFNSSDVSLRYYLGASTPIFSIPDDKSKEDKFKVVTSNSLVAATTYQLVLYNPDDFLHLGAVVYRGELDSVNSDGTTTYMHVENIRRVIIDKDDQKYGYRVMGTQYVNLRAKGKGTCQEASYYVSEDLYEEKAKEGNAFVVGDFIRIDVSKDTLTGWDFYDGIERGTSRIIYEPGIYTVAGSDSQIIVGYVVKSDIENLLLLVDCGDDGQRVFSPRAKGIIDVKAKETIEASLLDYYENELVYAIANGGHASFIIKNVNAD